MPSVKARNMLWIGAIGLLSIILFIVAPAGNTTGLAPDGNYFPSIFYAWPSPTPTPGPGRALITEIMYDPAGAEPDSEWIEIFNVGGFTLDLSGYKVGDEETPGDQEGMFQFPPGATLESGEVIVIANRAITFISVYGFPPDYELRESDPFVPNLLDYTNWASGEVNMSNSGDEVIILNTDDQWADSVSWGNSAFAFDPPVPTVSPGHSVERKPAYTDTDTASDWIEQDAPNPGQVDISIPTPTPTQPLPSEATPTLPGPLRLFISEVLYDPSEGDPNFEWIELYNDNINPLSLTGYKLGDEETSGGGEGMLLFPEGTAILPGQTLVIANRAEDFKAQYQFSPQFEMNDSDDQVPDMLRYSSWAGGSVNLSNSGDEVLLLSTQDELVDSLSWGSSNFAFDPSVPNVTEGHSLERYPPNSDSDTALDWRDQAHPAPGEVDLTPPTSTPTPTFTPTPTDVPAPTPVPTLVINEIHADPDAIHGDANGDGVLDVIEDEFIEIINITGSTVDLSGWQLSDSYRVRHTLEQGSQIPNGCAILVFGGGSPSGSFGGSLVQIASSGTLALNNSGDTLTLYDLSNQAVISYTYGTEAGDNQSLTRDPDINGPDPLVKHSTATGSDGALYSPGTRIDGTTFYGCSTWARLFSR